MERACAAHLHSEQQREEGPGTGGRTTGGRGDFGGGASSEPESKPLSSQATRRGETRYGPLERLIFFYKKIFSKTQNVDKLHAC